MKDAFTTGRMIRYLQNIATVEACELLCFNEAACVGFSYVTEKSDPKKSNHKECVLHSEARGTMSFVGKIAGKACPGN